MAPIHWDGNDATIEGILFKRVVRILEPRFYLQREAKAGNLSHALLLPEIFRSNGPRTVDEGKSSFWIQLALFVSHLRWIHVLLMGTLIILRLVVIHFPFFAQPLHADIIIIIIRRLVICAMVVEGKIDGLVLPSTRLVHFD